MLSESSDALRALTSIVSDFCCDETELRRLHSPDSWIVASCLSGPEQDNTTVLLFSLCACPRLRHWSRLADHALGQC